MKKFKILGARDLGRSIEYCHLEINADNKKQARNIFLKQTHFYEVLRIDEIIN